MTQPEPPKPRRQRPDAGWWRRNRWGLVALVPALAVLLALSAEDLYAVYARQPHKAVAASADGWYELRGTRIRLVDIGPATDLKTYDGQSFTPPKNVTIWRARIEFAVVQPAPPQGTNPLATPAPGAAPQPTGSPDPATPPETQLGGCTITLQDADGRIFGDDPNEMLDGVADVVSPGCTADYDVPDPLRYVNAVYFALPAGAEPVAVRINDIISLPGYVRLTPGRT